MWQDVKLLNAISNLLLGLVAVAASVSAVLWLIHRPFFALNTIHVEGMQKQELRHVSQLGIRDQALPKIRGNFFTANLDQVRAAFESVPWVRKASVQRVWPDQLLVSVEEYQAFGTWGEDGRLLSSQGDVFVANLAEAEEDTSLMSLTGPEGSEREVLQQYQLFKTWFARIGLVPEAVHYSNRYAWRVQLNNGLVVELGRAEEADSLQKRVEQLIRVYPQLLNRLQGSIVNIDLRYPNGLALKAGKGSFGFEKK